MPCPGKKRFRLWWYAYPLLTKCTREGWRLHDMRARWRPHELRDGAAFTELLSALQPHGLQYEGRLVNTFGQTGCDLTPRCVLVSATRHPLGDHACRKFGHKV